MRLSRQHPEHAHACGCQRLKVGVVHALPWRQHPEQMLGSAGRKYPEPQPTSLCAGGGACCAKIRALMQACAGCCSGASACTALLVSTYHCQG
jgi:hypothetical protein